MSNSIRFLKKHLKSSTTGVWIVIVFISLLLSGCVDYQVGANFRNANSGELVQRIKLGEKLTSFSGESVYDWLDSIERRAHDLNGRVKRVSQEEVIVKIPFNSGDELENKFYNFFHPHSSDRIDKTEPLTETEDNSELPVVESNLLLQENNFLLATRNKLIYDLDLRSLGLISSNGNSLVNPGSILDLEFALQTPLGATDVTESENAIEPIKDKGKLIWQLKPGEINHIEAAFWLPSPLGIGTLLIILFVWGGIYLRYTFMPDPKIQFAPTATSPINTSPTITE
ncbi:MAG: DUF3153 domain-containing protein [Cyanobacteria bacterium P01_A01_bin.84]